jgi:hypothetical protein
MDHLLASGHDQLHEVKGELRLLNWKVDAVLGLLVAPVVQALLLPVLRSGI